METPSLQHVEDAFVAIKRGVYALDTVRPSGQNGCLLGL